ncbi:MAG: hypothetical protein VB858_20160, partial [Planctomycetaceae bacterium]
WIGMLAAGGLELFWQVRFDATISRPASEKSIWRSHYLDLYHEGALEAQPSLQDDRFDLLLLGGSVAEQTENALQAALEKRLQLPVHIYTLARSGQSSRDSQIKFTRLTGKPFDCVLVYNGINDVTQNYVAESAFQLDYTHCNWYASFQKRLQSRRLTLTDVGEDLSLIGRSRPGADSYHYGTKIKTDRAVARNLQYITEHARAAGSLTALMTFGWHIPDDYSLARYKAGALDYAEGGFHIEVEFWGSPDQVPAIMRAQNEQIRILARETGIILIDQEKLLDGPQFYSDVCHFTPLGCQAFADNIIRRLFDESGGTRKVARPR